MRKFDFTGIDKIFELIKKGLKLKDICDRNGRAVHDDAKTFLLYHRQAKRMYIKHLITNWTGQSDDSL